MHTCAKDPRARSRPRPWALGPGLALLLATVAPAQIEGPSRAHAETLVRALDKAWNDADAEAFLACFDPIHKRLHRELSEHARLLLQNRNLLERSSHIEGLECRDGIAIAHVITKVGCSKLVQANTTQHHYLAMRLGGDGRARAMFRVDLDAMCLGDLERGRFACRACNYAIGGSRHWLAVPASKDTAGCMESLTFIALEHDLTLESSVTVALETVPAKKALESYFDRIQRAPWVLPSGAGKVEDWLPPYYDGRKARPKDLQGARCEVKLRAGPIAVLHLATFGPVRYLLVLEGEPATIAAQRPIVNDLLGSFRLLDDKRLPKDVVGSANFVHTGKGVLAGNTYSNKTHDVRIVAPAGFEGSFAACEHLFRVRFLDKATSAYISLAGMQPRGDNRTWSRDAADLLLTKWCQRTGLPVDLGTSPWQPPADKSPGGFEFRELRFKCPLDTGYWVVRMSMRPQLLLMVEGFATNPETLQEVCESLDSVGPAR